MTAENKHVSSVKTYRTVELFVSRLNPHTVAAELFNCVHESKGEFKYLGHKLSYELNDDIDIDREIRNMFVRTNILLRKFYRCSISVKISLFKSYCINLLGCALCSRFSSGVSNRFKSCYHKCLKVFFGYNTYSSVTNLLFELGLASFPPSFTMVLCHLGVC